MLPQTPSFSRRKESFLYSSSTIRQRSVFPLVLRYMLLQNISFFLGMFTCCLTSESIIRAETL